MSSFQAQSWVLVADMEVDPHSKPQVETLQNLQKNLKGAIFCNDPKFADSEACQKVPAFPCFCNVDTHACVAGLRETEEQFEELQAYSDQQKKLSSGL